VALARARAFVFWSKHSARGGNMRCMDWRSAALSMTLLLAAVPVCGQTVSRAYCGEDGRAHVVFQNGKQNTIEPETVELAGQQVECRHILVAGDRRTVVWAALFGIGTPSYPIALELVVLKNGKKIVITPGQMIWEWRFIGQGDRIAVLHGPTHGWASEANVYDSRTGMVLSSWNGRGEQPDWTNGWEDNFQPDEPRNEESQQ
jgi:hypothetical protein